MAESSPHYAQEFLADLTAKIAWIAEVDFTGSPATTLRKACAACPIGTAASITAPIATASWSYA
nr:hypothetical protein [Rhizobium leguminosarum]